MSILDIVEERLSRIGKDIGDIEWILMDDVQWEYGFRKHLDIEDGSITKLTIVGIDFWEVRHKSRYSNGKFYFWFGYQLPKKKKSNLVKNTFAYFLRKVSYYVGVMK